MIIIQATIHTIEPFDAAKGTTVTFSWSGNQIYRVRCLVKVNSTGVTAYDSTVTSMKETFTIPASSGLSNGTYYVAYITVFDVNGTESDQQSIGMPFYCFTTPAFNLSISSGDVVAASTYTVSLSYSQTEGEELDSYQILLYSYQKSQLQASELSYDTSNMYYTLSEMENATQYYVRALGTTVHGMEIDTGYILFSVAYTQSQLFSMLELNNIASTGAIEIRTNIIACEGEASSDVIYLASGGVNLINNQVTFDQGWSVDGDFTAVFRIRQPVLNKNIITISSEDKNVMISIYYREGSYESSDGTQGFFEMYLSIGSRSYNVIMSNFFDIMTASQEAVLYLQRQNGYYELYALITDIEDGDT